MSAPPELSSVEEQPTPARHIDLGRRRVSVIIPCYNHAQFLGAAIRSVLNQSYNDYEIIVVDDGSTDNTQNVVASFMEQVRYIRQENQGLSAARNTGLRAAKGEMIGLLDADDLYEPVFLETLISVLRSDPTLDGVYCSALTVDHLNTLLPQRIGNAVTPELFRSTLLDGGFFPPLCMFAHKYCYQEKDHLFDNSLSACEDWDMWLRFSRCYKIMGVDQALVRYRVLPDSMSRDPVRMSTNREAVLKKFFTVESTSGSHSKVYQRAFGRSHVRTAAEYLQAQDPRTAYHYFETATKTDPEILVDPAVFYELALGAQQMGYRGDFVTVDLQRNACMLINWLDQIFMDPNLSSDLESKRSAAYGNAYRVFGLLSYGKRDFAGTRRYLRRALASEPRHILKFQIISTLVKSLLPAQVLGWLRKRRQASTFS